MTVYLSFEREHRYNTGSDLVWVSIRVHVNARPFAVGALLDTGSWITVFDHALAPLLGISDVTTGQPGSFTAANGQEDEGYIHPLELEFVGRRFTVPVGFIPAWPTGRPNILGMRGFFEQLQIAFVHGNRRFYV